MFRFDFKLVSCIGSIFGCWNLVVFVVVLLIGCVGGRVYLKVSDVGV